MLKEGDCNGSISEEADAIIFAGWMEVREVVGDLEKRGRRH